MTLPIFPIPLGTVGGSTFFKWSPVFFNQSQKTVSGASIDIALASTPLHNFEFIVDWMRDPGTTPGASSFTGSEWRATQGFFMSLGGSLGRFLFLNPDDNNVTAQVIGTYNATGGTFPIVRSYGDPSVAVATETVGFVKIFGTLNVYFNGVLQTSGVNYAINNATPGAPLLALITLPSIGTVITMDFTFYYYCKFADDTMTFEKFINQLWSNQSIKIQSCRPGA